MFGPKALDPAIVARLNLAVKKALELTAVREKMTSLGNVPRYETVEQLRATVKAGRGKQAEVVKTSGASIDQVDELLRLPPGGILLPCARAARLAE